MVYSKWWQQIYDDDAYLRIPESTTTATPASPVAAVSSTLKQMMHRNTTGIHHQYHRRNTAHLRGSTNKNKVAKCWLSLRTVSTKIILQHSRADFRISSWDDETMVFWKTISYSANVSSILRESKTSLPHRWILWIIVRTWMVVTIAWIVEW